MDMGFIKINLEDIKDADLKREHGDIKGLAENIKRNGLLQPIVINQNNNMVSGRRRYAALKMLGWTEVHVNQIETKDDVDKLSKTLAENIMRKNLRWQEEVRQKAEIDQLMREKYGSAKPGGDRQTKAGKKHRSDSDQWSTQKTAELLNQSKTVIIEDMQLARALEEYPELEKIERKSFAKRTYKQMQKRYEIDKIPKQELKGKYNVILADPPWDYDTKATALRGRALDHYSTMTIEEIRDIPVKNITLDNAALFLWTTNPITKKAFSVVESWGFEYKTLLVWIKDKIGTGFYARSKNEIILIGIKGSFLPMTTNLPETVFYAKKGSHSSKPEIIYKIIEKMYPGQKYIELFKRGENRKNWESWGKDISLPFN